MTSLQIIGCLMSLVVLYVLGRSLAVRQLVHDKTAQHVFFGCTVGIFLLWMLKVGIIEGMSVHFLWASALTLVLGYRWAIVSGGIALVGLTLIGNESIHMLGVNFLLGVCLPISVCYASFSLAFYKLPRNLFVYIFFCAFFPAAISIGLKMLALSAYFYIEGPHDWYNIYNSYLKLSVLMFFPEAMFSGMTITILIVHKPQWVYTFHDKFYIDGK